MTDDTTKRATDDRAPWWVVAFGAGALTTFVVAYAWLRASHHLEWHAWIGDALAPVASLFSLLAVIAALWSVHVQRRELALQRLELRETREEMKAQREQFERTAKAQERLAEAEEALAKVEGDAFHQQSQQLERQAEANILQRMNVVALVSSTLIDVATDIIDKEMGGRPKSKAALQDQRMRYVALAETALDAVMANLPPDLSLSKELGRKDRA